MSTPPNNNALIAYFLATIPGAEIVSIRDAGTNARRQDSSGELPFQSMAPRLWQNGWGIYPQSHRDGRRAPAIIDGKMITTGHLQQGIPSRADQDYWIAGAPKHNAALMLGPVAGGPFVIDGDIRDLDIAHQVLQIAAEMLPPTPFQRGSDGAKFGLVYRSCPSDPILSSRSHELRDEADLPIRDGMGKVSEIEILAAGKSFTLVGLHHGTGRHFTWTTSPLMRGPEHAPLVTATQVRAFLQAVNDRLFKLTRLGAGYDLSSDRVATGAVSAATSDSSGIVIPGGRETTPKTTYDADGKIVNGRESYVLSRSMRYGVMNRGLMQTPEGRRAIAGALFRECQEIFAGIGSGRYTSWGTESGHAHNAVSSVLQDCRAKVESAKRVLRDDPSKTVRRIGREETGKPHLTVRTGVGIDRGSRDALSWIDPAAVSLSAIIVTGQAQKALDRAIRTDPAARAAEQDRVSGEVTRTIDKFLDQADEQSRNDKARLCPLILLKAPVGAGKTSTAIERIAARPRRKRAILFFMPSYANIEEAVSRASQRKSAVGVGYTPIFREAVAEATAEAERLGLKVGTLTGMERAGCLMKEQRAFLRQQGAPAHGLCEAKVTTLRNEAPETVHCKHHPKVGGACPVIPARQALTECDLIFLPTAFLTLGIPEVLKDHVCASIIDERCVFELIKYDTMNIDSLLLARPEPRILPCDGDDVSGHDMLHERNAAAEFVHAALMRREDPAAAILAANDPKLLANVTSAKTVASRGQRAAMQVVPNMALEQLTEIFNRAKATDLAVENRLWGTIIERLEALKADALTRALAAHAGVPVDPSILQARGDRDMRIQVLDLGDEGTKIRVSWREDPILSELPTLLLDASADAGMIEKAWGGRDVESVEINAYLHVQTAVCLDSAWSTTSLVPALAGEGEDARRVARNVNSIRRVINNVAHVYAHGRVGVAMPMRVRRAVMTAHVEAPNLDLMHYGAIRGLDFAKTHKAMITIGRHEFPVWVIDALAAALTYDEPEPEMPFDRYGNGIDEVTGDRIKMPMVDRVIELRDGRDLTIQVNELPGRWGYSIQRQFREEELLQSMGRLRPVYRDEIGTWIAVSRVVPEGIVVDAVTTVESLSQARGAGDVFEAIRRTGVGDATVIAKVAPDACPHPVTALRNTGLRGEDGPGTWTAGFDKWSISTGGETRTVLIPAYQDASEIVDAYDRAGIRVDSLRLVSEAAHKVPSQARVPDKVDAEMGTRDERRVAEDEARALVRPHVPEPKAPFGEDMPLRLGRPAAHVDVEVAMILASQCKRTPEEAVREARAKGDEATDGSAASASSDAQASRPPAPMVALRGPMPASVAAAASGSPSASAPAAMPCAPPRGLTALRLASRSAGA